MKSRKLPHTVPGYVSLGFFILGLASAVAFRIIVVLQRIEPAWVRPAWYAGALGYIGFFTYRYAIARKRKRAIEDFNLIEKIRSNTCLDEEEKDVIMYLLSSLKKSPEDVNYLIIFLLSLLAILADVLLGFYG